MCIVQSFKVRRGLLLTQLPLPDTLVDLWRLVEGCEVNTIVSLGSKDEHRTVKVSQFLCWWCTEVGYCRCKKKKTEILYAESPELSKVPPFESRVAEYDFIALHPSLSARNSAPLVSVFQVHSPSVFHHSSPSSPWRTAEI